MRPLRLLAATLALAAAIAAHPAGAVDDAPRGWVVERVRFTPTEPAALLEADGRAFRGSLELGPAGGGVAVVNDVGLEDYVKGIAEVPPSWPIEAQKAQAIAARTYALHSLLRTRHRGIARVLGADICATQACQVYTGLAGERRAGGDRWAAAVDATRHQLLLYRGGPILAQYSSTNGGRTVRGSRPYLWEVDDPDDAASPYHRWRVDFGAGDIERLFRLAGPLVAAGTTGDTVVLTARQPDGTDYPLQMSRAHFRSELNRAFGPRPGLPSAVPSSRYAVGFDNGRVLLDGGGWGHGIGMSQYGALGKARRGMQAPDILAAYYGGIRPVAVDPARLPASIRVVVEDGRQTVSVASAGSFDVTDEAGNPLVGLGTGAWRIEPAGGGRVRVVPPEGYEQPLRAAALEPPVPVAGQQPTVRFALAAPAAVTVKLLGPAGEATVAEGRLPSGEHAVPLRQATPGEWQVVVEASTGRDRVATVPIPFRVDGPQPAPAPAAAAQAAPSPAVPAAVPAAAAGKPPAAVATAAAMIVLVSALLLGRVGPVRR